MKTYYRSSIFFLILVIGITIYFFNYPLQKPQIFEINSSPGNASLFFAPNSPTFNPAGTLELWVTTDKPLAFSRVELSFDPSHLQLDQEITLTTPALKRLIKVSTMAEANNTGQLTLLLGLDPTTLSQAPTDSFQLATLHFISQVETANLSTPLSFIPNNLQLIDTGATAFVLSSTPANITLKPASHSIDLHDYALLLENYSQTGTPGWIVVDYDKNGQVNLYDYSYLIAHFGQSVTL